MGVNERRVNLRSGVTNYPTLKDYMDRRRVVPLPFGENAKTAVAGANYVLIDSSMLVASTIGVSTSTFENGGLFATLLAGAVGTGSTNITSDSLGNILNMVKIRNADTHDAITESGGREIFGLIQAVSTALDGDAIGASGSENLQLSFVYVAEDGTLTLTNLTETIEFSQNNVYLERLLPTIMKEGGNADADALSIDPITGEKGEYLVTTGFILNEVITTTTGVGASAGVSTQSGDVVDLDASASAFNADDLLHILLNGIEVQKGSDVIWDSSSTFHFAHILDAGDEFTIKKIR